MANPAEAAHAEPVVAPALPVPQPLPPADAPVAAPDPTHRPASTRMPWPDLADAGPAEVPVPYFPPPPANEHHRYRMLQDLALDPAAPPQDDPPAQPHRAAPRPAMPALRSAQPPGSSAWGGASLDELSQRSLLSAPPRAPGTSPRGTRPRRAWPR